MSNQLRRRLVAEFTGTAVLVCTIVGSGIMATSLTSDTGLALVISALSTVLGLALLIWLLGPVSGAHFNPVVSLAVFLQKSMNGKAVLAYVAVQLAGGTFGAIVANAMYGLALVGPSAHTRGGVAILLGEVIATAGLIATIGVLGKRGAPAHVFVPAWIGSAYFFTSSTSFANPAVTIGRVFTDSFAGISAGSVFGFAMAQLIGALIGIQIGSFINRSGVEA